MRQVLIGEFGTFYRKIYIWGGTALFLIIMGWYLNHGYSIRYAYIQDEAAYITGESGNHTDLEKEAALKKYYVDMTNSAQVILPANSVQHSLEVLMGFGIFLFPMMSAVYIGNEYMEKVMGVKALRFGLKRVILAKIIVLLGYLLAMTGIVLLMGWVFSMYQWNIHGSLIEDISSMITMPSGNFEPLQILGVLGALTFYSALVAVASMLFRNGFTGVMLTVMLAEGEKFLQLAILPRWVIFGMLESVFPANVHNFFELGIPDSMDHLPNWMRITLLMVYSVVILVVFLRCLKKNILE